MEPRFTVFATKSYGGLDGFKINDALRGVGPSWYVEEKLAQSVADELNKKFMTVEEANLSLRDKKENEYNLNLVSGERTKA